MTLRLAAHRLRDTARRFLVFTLIFAIGPTAPLLGQVSAISQSVASTPMSLHITILEGEDALNSIRERTAREPIVEVDDENHKPVAGALLLFSIQNGGGGAGGTFNGLNTLSVTTGADGRGIAHGLRPNQTAGTYTIGVTATLGVLVATVVIHQTNVLAAAAAGATAASTTAATAATSETTTSAAAGAGAAAGTETAVPSTASKIPHRLIHFGSKRFWIAGGTAVAVGVVVGVVVATRGNSPTTITPGTGTVGP